MITALVSTFLIAHGLLHLVIWAVPARVDQSPPFAPGDSWALSAAGASVTSTKVAATAVASVTTLLYIIAGAAAAAQSGGWAPAAVLAAASGLVLKGLWFHPWLGFGLALDAEVITAVAMNWPASLY
ncbi:hypothetical protein ACH4Q7_26795 [Streptomyces roseolus]|uniref:hypothetical protein n=1 Tax=Streptomyces roseolus TaxID=67358 RepID=UPI00379642A1